MKIKKKMQTGSQVQSLNYYIIGHNERNFFLFWERLFKNTVQVWVPWIYNFKKVPQEILMPTQGWEPLVYAITSNSIITDSSSNTERKLLSWDNVSAVPVPAFMEYCFLNFWQANSKVYSSFSFRQSCQFSR